MTFIFNWARRFEETDKLVDVDSIELIIKQIYYKCFKLFDESEYASRSSQVYLNDRALKRKHDDINFTSLRNFRRILKRKNFKVINVRELLNGAEYKHKNKTN
jgi:hypothetical protein